MSTYQELVKLGREALAAETSAQWKLGDYALQVCPLDAKHLHNQQLEKLERYADDLGVSFETLRAYRATAAAWPDDTRVSSDKASWKVHQYLQGKPDRIQIIERLLRAGKGRVTVNQVTIALGRKTRN